MGTLLAAPPMGMAVAAVVGSSLDMIVVVDVMMMIDSDLCEQKPASLVSEDGLFLTCTARKDHRSKT